MKLLSQECTGLLEAHNERQGDSRKPPSPELYTEVEERVLFSGCPLYVRLEGTLLSLQRTHMQTDLGHALVFTYVTGELRSKMCLRSRRGIESDRCQLNKFYEFEIILSPFRSQNQRENSVLIGRGNLGYSEMLFVYS